MNLIAYIPARGGSKRIPRKNIKSLKGTPILGHVIKNLKEVSFLEGICVSTDDSEIQKTAENSGAVTLDLRKQELANDFATFDDLLRKDVPRYIKHFNLNPAQTGILFFTATAALVTSDVISKAYSEFIQKKAKLLFSTVSYDISPFWALSLNSENKWQPLFPEKLTTRSQDLPQTQADACLFYFLNWNAMVEHKGPWLDMKDGLICFPVDKKIAVDVDTLEDWSVLEMKYEKDKK